MADEEEEEEHPEGAGGPRMLWSTGHLSADESLIFTLRGRRGRKTIDDIRSCLA